MEENASLGYWLRRRRKMLDMTQEVLAERVHCSVATIRKIEIDLRRPSRELAELLANALEIEAKDRPLFLKVARGERATDRLAVLPQPPVELSKSKMPHSTLPTPSSTLIGRERELAEVQRLLNRSDGRLVTITGSGGVGKTRLALEVARSFAGKGEASSPLPCTFADGVFYVALTALISPESVAAAIVNSLGLGAGGLSDPQQQLMAALRGKELLLVLDNIEPTGAVELVAELLYKHERLRVLVTSRERLELAGEWIFTLQGLSVPELSQAVTLSTELERYSAVTLFVESAGRVQANFALSEEEALHVARICRLVDGVPLAIELAAAWVHMLSCREIAAEIEQNLDFLSVNRRDLPERHRSLRAAFEYSWKLLSAEQQRVLRQLSIFRGGFTREAASAIVEATLPQLSALISKSLLVRAAKGRYQLHELVRQYAEEKLATKADEAANVRSRHSIWYGNFVGQREARLHGDDALQVIAELNSEVENILVAWRCAILRRDRTTIEKPLKSLWFFFTLRSTNQEAESLFRWAVQELEQSGEESLLCHLRSLYQWFQRRESQQAAFRRLLEEQGITTPLADTFYSTGLLEWITTYATQAEALAGDDFGRFLDLAREWSTICALKLVARAALAQEDINKAKQLNEVILDIANTAQITQTINIM